MKPRHPPPLQFAEAGGPPPMSAVNFSRTPLGRAMLHMECLCHHPAAARFHFQGLTRNLREYAEAVKTAALKSVKKVAGKKSK
jgi:hypothetical protein